MDFIAEFLPFYVFAESVAQPDGQAVHRHRHQYKDESSRSGVIEKCWIWPRGPVEHLDRHDGKWSKKPIEQASGRVAGNRRGREKGNEGERSDGDDRSRFADGTSHPDDHSGQNTGTGVRHDMMADNLPGRRSAGIGSLANDLRD